VTQSLLLGGAIEPRLTVDGIRNLLLDLRTQGKPMPEAILVSEYDRRELNQDVLGHSASEVAKDDQKPDHDRAAIAVIEGVLIACHPDIRRGKARLIFPAPEKSREGTGKIIVGAG